MEEKAQVKIEELDRESHTRTHFPKWLKRFITVLAAGLALFHLYTSYAGSLVDIQQRSVHLYALLALGFLLYPLWKKGKKDRIPVFDYVTSGLSLFVGIYMLATSSRIIETGGQINHMDFVVGILVIILLLDITRRVTGWGLTLLGLGFLIYGLYVKLSVYPMLNTNIVLNVSKQVISHLVFITEGVLGTAVGVSASYIILFILFGAFLTKSGMGQLFNDLALAIAGHTKGGPAKVAVISSGFLGSINGSAIANVVTTGAFTIPLMKKTGYHKNFAGAVESAASVGGQILPPIMGAAAFIMAENLGIPYTKVILAGIIPALLFYFGILLQVHLRASRKGLQGMDRKDLPAVKEVLLERGHLIVPMIFLLYLLFTGKTPFFAAFWSIVASIIIASTRQMLVVMTVVSLFLIFQPQIMSALGSSSAVHVRSDWWELLLIVLIPLVINLIRKKANLQSEEIGLNDFVDALESGAKTTVPVAIACGAVGIIVGVATLTGVALEIANSIVGLGAIIDSALIQLLITLVLTMVTSIILGMGLPSIPTYIITSTMTAPILLQLPLFRELAGSSETAVFVAHMFVFYFGIFANITPPVALAAFAGAGISGGDPTKTGFQALKLALAGFIVPFMFVFSHEMLMVDATAGNVLLILVTSLLGVFLLSVTAEGYFQSELSAGLRMITGIGALLLIYPGWVTDMIGLLILGLLLILSFKQNRMDSDTSVSQ
ncbi:TRAP transporter 4TM/12TM fusion protein [Melghiribacillus thermohalophilus]|uniref:TRAP transporter 4TM/12TM fusion protein n=1 Tax=Melghiribacillus thermohalophilus TaxID=1324956 RepID=A0A4V2V0U7_9BACI|nr:TRAP transporter permease [Melghiribacillus thermohalophilus]TCT18277.1 TRAP transporter 4TM/12TM fusion protein [Melghiribacillus thermohalophilus]